MSWGSSHSPETMQSFMENGFIYFLRTHYDVLAEVYLDDIIIGHEDYDRVVEACQALLAMFDKVKVNIANSKSQLTPVRTIDWLGFLLDSTEITDSNGNPVTIVRLGVTQEKLNAMVHMKI